MSTGKKFINIAVYRSFQDTITIMYYRLSHDIVTWDEDRDIC